MKILLLNLYYPPDTSATAKMAATVVEALSPQHEVTVLCGRPSYDPTEREPWRPDRLVGADRVHIADGVDPTLGPEAQMATRLTHDRDQRYFTVTRV